MRHNMPHQNLPPGVILPLRHYPRILNTNRCLSTGLLPYRVRLYYGTNLLERSGSVILSYGPIAPLKRLDKTGCLLANDF